MEKANKLEQIFWIKGKFLKANGEEVNPKSIEGPKLISIERDIKNTKISKEDLIKYLKRNYNSVDANSFSIGKKRLSSSSDNLIHNYNTYSYPVQFYKI